MGVTVSYLFILVLLMSTIRYFEGRYPHPYLLLLPLTSCILLSLPYFSFFTSSPLFRIPFPSPLTYNLYHSHALSSCTAYSPSSYMSHNPPPLLFALQPQPLPSHQPLNQLNLMSYLHPPPSPDTVALQFSCSP